MQEQRIAVPGMCFGVPGIAAAFDAIPTLALSQARQKFGDCDTLPLVGDDRVRYS
jgi:hypothetical protein